MLIIIIVTHFLLPKISIIKNRQMIEEMIYPTGLKISTYKMQFKIARIPRIRPLFCCSSSGSLLSGFIMAAISMITDIAIAIIETIVGKKEADTNM